MRSSGGGARTGGRPAPPAASASVFESRIVVGAWLAWSALALLPYAQAWLWPPAGTRSTGLLHYQDDVLQHLSFAEQVSHGVFVFENKFDVRPTGAFLVNLEWWVVGVLSAALRGRLVGGFHLAGVLAAAGFVLVVTRLLRLAGLSGARLGWGLGLVLAGGGLGWLRGILGVPPPEIGDMRYTIYPWHQVYGPHAILGSTLLLGALVFLAEWRASAGPRWRWLACGVGLTFSRPYDLALLIAVAALLAVSDGVRGADLPLALGRAAELLWFAPGLFYVVLAFRLHPSFSLWGGPQNVVPRLAPLAFAEAFVPAVALVALGLLAERRGADREKAVAGTPATSAAAAEARLALLLALAAVTAFAASGLTFALQFLNAVGPILLVLAASATPPRLLPAAAIALSPTSLFLFWFLMNPVRVLFVPRDQLAAVDALREACRPGDLAFAPPRLSLLVAGLTPCRVAVGHRVLTPDYETRVRESARFYDPMTDPSWRSDYLRGLGAAFVVLPPSASGWLGLGAPYRRRAAFAALEVWETTIKRVP